VCFIPPRLLSALTAGAHFLVEYASWAETSFSSSAGFFMGLGYSLQSNHPIPC